MGNVLDAAGVDITLLWPALEAASDRLGIGIFVTRVLPAPLRLLYVSDWLTRLTGRTVDQLVGEPFWTMVRPEHHETLRARMAQPTGQTIELTVVRPDGSEVPVEVAGTRIATSDGLVSFGYVRDLSSERRAERALGESEALFRSLVEVAPDGITIVANGKIVFLNQRSAEIFGVDARAALGASPLDHLQPADATAVGERIAETLRSGAASSPNEYRSLAHPDRVVEVRSARCTWEGGPAIVAFARDVTERKAIDARLARADRLTALGTLAAGVAHEINNPLAYAQLSLHHLAREPGGERAARAIADIDHALARIAAITASLRTFARPDDTPPGPVDVVAVVERALRMVDNDLRHRGELARDVAPDLPPVTGNASRFEQLFVNLVINAIQAVEPGTPVRLELAIAERDERVVVTLRDNGRGIPPEHRDRVFEPFFTTKREGMGLGLAVCKSIAEGAGGSLELAPHPSGGTVATVALRVHPRAAAASPPRAGRVRAQRLRVLVVDDEAPLREILADLLADEHEVASAASGTEALELVGARTFDAIVCDLMMPGLDGRELHQRIAALRPGLERRIVFMTGGILDRARERFLARAGNPYLMKPFDVDEVFAALANIAAP